MGRPGRADGCTHSPEGEFGKQFQDIGTYKTLRTRWRSPSPSPTTSPPYQSHHPVSPRPSLGRPYIHRLEQELDGITNAAKGSPNSYVINTQIGLMDGNNFYPTLGPRQEVSADNQPKEVVKESKTEEIMGEEKKVREPLEVIEDATMPRGVMRPTPRGRGGSSRSSGASRSSR